MAHLDLHARSWREGDDPQRPVELELAVGRRPVVVVASRASQRRIQTEQAATVVLGLIPAPNWPAWTDKRLPAPVGRAGWL